MKKFFLFLFALTLGAVNARAYYTWTDDSGVTWQFNYNYQYQYAEIIGATDYGTDIVIPEEVYYQGNPTKVGRISFSGDIVRNAKVTLSNTVEKIYSYANNRASTLVINNPTPPVLEQAASKVFGSCTTVLVPEEYVETYRTADGWKDIEVNILSQTDVTDYDVSTTAQGSASGLHMKIGEENLGKVMSLKVSGTINSYDILLMRNKMYNLHHLDLTNATIKANDYKYYESYSTTDNVLGTCAFYGMTKLMGVKLPASITSIGDKAFYQCYSLQDVVFPDGLKSIGTYAFFECHVKDVKLANLDNIAEGAFSYGCHGTLIIKSISSIGKRAFAACSLTSATIEKCNVIGETAFENCSSLQTVTLGSCSSISKGAFSGCGIEMVALPSDGSLESIGPNAFRYCRSLKSIVIPAGIKTLEFGTFNTCTSLESVTLPPTLISTTKGNYTTEGAFYGCSSLSSVVLPFGMQTIANGTFKSCSALTEIKIPSTIRTIGTEAFAGCTNLKDYYAYTLEPTDIQESTFSNWTTATLHVPTMAYYNYYYDTQWSKFAHLVLDADYEFPYYYLCGMDYTYTDDIDVSQSTPDVQLDGGTGLVVETTGTVGLGEVHLADNGTVAASIIANDNLTAESLVVDMAVQKGKWYFLSMPFRVKMANIEAPGQYVFRYYDGQARATNGSGGWKNYTGTYLLPGQGYIFQCNAAGTLSMTVEQADLDFSGGDRQDQLQSYAAESTQNASWNFLGNPHSSYFDIDDTGYEAPITVWNGTSYVAVRAGDDQYHLSPLQGFFVQKPEGTAELSFPASGRHTYNQWAERVAEKQSASRQRRAASAGRLVVNLTIGSDAATTDDQTRVVYNEAKSLDYEMDCDAAKFMSDQPVAQLYSLGADGTRYAINERPQGEVALGYVAPQQGELTIGAVRMDGPVLLRDNLLAVTHDLSLGGYTFTTDAGTFNSRFTLMPADTTTAIDAAETATDGTSAATRYTLDGRRLPADGGQTRGAIVVKEGNKATKVINTK